MSVSVRRSERSAGRVAAVLVAAIGQLHGLIAYYAGADPVANAMVNVGVWDSIDAAEQMAMASLPEMQALAGDFQEVGIEFERPIVNYDALRQI